MRFRKNVTFPFIAAACAALASPAGWAAQPAALDSNVPCGGAVVVESGDTLGDIASLCGVASFDIQSVNSAVNDWNLLYPGQRLVIPTAVAVAAPDARALNELLAPFALYPDALLAELLPAATYPLELVQAERWARENPGADPAAEGWAPSVAALTRYPEVLERLSTNLDQTIEIGDAFLADPDAVFAAIQDLRGQAQTAGNLETNDYQEVIVEPVETVTHTEIVEPVVEVREVIRIVPRYSQRIYVPSYDSYWAYRYHPDYYGAFRRPVFSFGVHYGYGTWLSHYIDWGRYHVGVFPFAYRQPHYHYNPSRYLGRSYNRVNYWHHQPRHRRGYRYIAQPRVRISEGQRHLVRVQKGSSNRFRGRSTGSNDYRSGERRQAIARSNTRRSGNLATRIRSNDARSTNGARSTPANRTARNTNSASRTMAASDNRQRRNVTSERRIVPAEDRADRQIRASRADQTRTAREDTLRRLQAGNQRQTTRQHSSNRQQATRQNNSNRQTANTTRNSNAQVPRSTNRSASRPDARTTTQRSGQRQVTRFSRSTVSRQNGANPRAEREPVTRAQSRQTRPANRSPVVGRSQPTRQAAPQARQQSTQPQRSAPAPRHAQKRDSSRSRQADSAKAQRSSRSAPSRSSSQRERQRR